MIVKNALYFAAQKHNGQYRKGNKVPYITHPVLVAFTLQKYTSNQNIIAAALLHDVLEDCLDVSYLDIEKKFGKKIATLVQEVSFLEKNLTHSWKIRKKIYLNKIKNVGKNALLIICADKMSNMQAYFDAILTKNKINLKEFGGTIKDYYWFYTEIGKILIQKIPHQKIVRDYIDLLTTYKKS